MNLVNEKGEEVELVDTVTSEVLGEFDVQNPHRTQKAAPNLKLVVDNTKK